MTSLNQKIRLTLALSAVSIGLAACGGGGGDGNGSSADSSLIIGGPSGQPASDATVEEIQQAAVKRASEGLGLNLNSLQQLGDDALVSLDEDSLASSLLGDTDTTGIQTLNADNDNFLANSVGLNSTTATVQRSGNIITIDPDEQSLCADEFPLVDSLNDNVSECQQLASDLMVEIDAASDESGVITYLFQNAPVLLIGYSPMGASYELNFAGMQRVIERSAQISGSSETLGIDLAGAIRLSAFVLNDEPGSEAGELAMNVTQALSLMPTDGSASRFNLQPSTVFSISADEATGDVSTSVNWGALELITESGQADSDGNSSTSINSIFLGGLTGNANVNADRPALSLTNIGIGNVPLTVTIDQVESLSLNVDTLGITLDDETGMLTLDGALGAALTLNNMMGLVDTLGSEITANFGINAPAGTTLSSSENGSTLVGGNGSLTVSADGASNGQSVQQSVTINDGECFDSTDEDDSESLALDIAVVDCNSFLFSD